MFLSLEESVGRGDSSRPEEKPSIEYQQYQHMIRGEKINRTLPGFRATGPSRNPDSNKYNKYINMKAIVHTRTDS